MKLSNYSLSYGPHFTQGQLDVFRFLGVSRDLGVEGASLHIRQMESTLSEYLKRVRRGYLDAGLAVSQLTVSTNFGLPAERHEDELKKAREAVRVGLFLGAPLIRIFAGSPQSEDDRVKAFERATASVRKLCEEAAKEGMPIGLQNHNHGALCRTGDDVVRFFKMVDHPNLTFVLDTGQFAGSKGASGKVPAELASADFMDSIRQTASLARYVRVKFYNPRPDGSEPWIDYDKVLDMLRGVHYSGFLDIVYEPGGSTGRGEDAMTAIPRVVKFLRGKIGVTSGVDASAKPQAARYAGLENDRFLADQQVRTETSVAFLEGPAVDRNGNVYFSNIPAERVHKWDPKARKLTVVRENSNQANGHMFDRQGRLVACEGGGKVTRFEIDTGKLTVLADSYQNKPLGAPNDLEIDAQGRIYFTSRLSNRDPQAGNVNAVYCIDPDGKIARILAIPDIDMPNGIATSPDDKILYLIDADSRENRARRIRAYDLKADGTVANQRLLYDFYPGRSGDGMRVDVEGNLYVAAGLHRRRGGSETLDTRPGIHVISPAGKLLAFIETPEDTITNCAFGGPPDWRTLYVTCGKLLLSMRTKIPGKKSYRGEV